MISKDSTLISKQAGCQLQFGSSLPQQQPLGQTITPGMRQGKDFFKKKKKKLYFSGADNKN